jgi:hypothetical protein
LESLEDYEHALELEPSNREAQAKVVGLRASVKSLEADESVEPSNLREKTREPNHPA